MSIALIFRTLRRVECARWCSAHSFRIGLITDGDSTRQRRKVDALRLPVLFDPLVVTGDWGPAFWKPHCRAYEFIESAWRCSGAALVYIGDDVRKDFKTARERGWFTIKIEHPRQLSGGAVAPDDTYVSEVVVTDVHDLPHVLAACARI